MNFIGVGAPPQPRGGFRGGFRGGRGGGGRGGRGGRVGAYSVQQAEGNPQEIKNDDNSAFLLSLFAQTKMSLGEDRLEQLRSSPFDCGHMQPDAVLVSRGAKGKEIPVHSFIVSAHSKALGALLRYSCWEKEHHRVTFHNFSSKTLKILVEYFYTHAINEESQSDFEDMTALLLAADQYGIEALKSKCLTAINKIIDGLQGLYGEERKSKHTELVDEVLNTYVVADRLNLESLKEKVADLIIKSYDVFVMPLSLLENESLIQYVADRIVARNRTYTWGVRG